MTTCNGYEGGSDGATAVGPGAAAARAPECARCGAVIAGAVYVALVLQVKWDDWPEEWEWEDVWWPDELCAACFGDRPVRCRGRCVHCGREIATSVHISGAARAYCWGGCRWDAEHTRRDEARRDVHTKVCGWCAAPFAARRSDAFWCSGRCRVAACRARTTSARPDRSSSAPSDPPCATVTPAEEV